jgi:hypothetical protein
MKISEFDRQRMDLSCLRCDKPGTLVRYRQGPHVGVRCNDCGVWHYWLKQDVSTPADEVPPKPVPKRQSDQALFNMRKIAHPITLEERVASLEHDVAILSQMIIGKARTDVESAT